LASSSSRPLRELFKDEVRAVGEVLGLPENLVWRHPFPGPGLAVRVIGEVTSEKLRVLRDGRRDRLEELIAANLYRRPPRSSRCCSPSARFGWMGDARTYDSVIAIRAVETRDFMTADWARIPFVDDAVAHRGEGVEGMRAQSAVMKSRVSTARMAITLS